jgi:hypothetical protein
MKNEKENGLVIRKSKIDWLKIIDLAFKRKDWGRTYTLYTLGDVTINCVMRQFDFSRSTADFKVSCSYRYKEKIYGGDEYENYELICYFINNFTIDDFKRIVNKKIIYMIENILSYRLKKEAKEIYSEFEYTRWNLDLDEEVEGLGLTEDYETIKSLDNKDIKNMCLSKFEDKALELLNGDFNEKVRAYIINNVVDIPNLIALKENITESVKKAVGDKK